MMIAEGLHENKIVKIADEIAAKKSRVKLILIAGPSSSGKTTFSRRLRIQLEVMGIKTCVLGTDDYFVDRKNTPVNENGDYDFESIEAVDVKLLNKHLSSLLAGKEVKIPRFNFKKGRRLKNAFSRVYSQIAFCGMLEMPVRISSSVWIQGASTSSSPQLLGNYRPS